MLVKDKCEVMVVETKDGRSEMKQECRSEVAVSEMARCFLGRGVLGGVGDMKLALPMARIGVHIPLSLQS